VAMQVRTTELGVLAVDFDRWATGLDEKTGAVVRKAAFDIEAHAKANAPVDTGFLRNSIVTRITSSNAMVQSAQVVAEASYAVFQEWGTARSAPRLFLTRAVDTVEPSFYAALAAIAGPGWASP
jgi:HK97 gp10 family phage protein